ncbi:uncharacterized protein METZ01_LOCUS179190, partial [marine metagenome]
HNQEKPTQWPEPRKNTPMPIGRVDSLSCHELRGLLRPAVQH